MLVSRLGYLVGSTQKTMAKKCRQCGLVNWDYEELCKRCSASLNAATPPVYKWFVVYCILMALLNISTMIMGIVFISIEPDPEMTAVENKIMGSMFFGLGLVFGVPYAIAPFLPRKSWVWVFGLVLICIGLTSACCLPVCIPSLINILVETRDERVLRSNPESITSSTAAMESRFIMINLTAPGGLGVTWALPTQTEASPASG
jgi:hypothetical protein